MKTEIKQLVAPTSLTSTVASLYSSPANKETLITKVSVLNRVAAAVKVTIHIVPDGGSPSSSNMLVKDKILVENEEWSAFTVEGQVLPPGASLQALTDAAGNTGVTLAASGAVIVN